MIKIIFSLAFIFSSLSYGDEGMWLFNQFPKDQVRKKHGFAVTDEWLDHVRLSSARLARGCSGSFVSDQGLVLTNHHCAQGCIQQLSSAQKDYMIDGFYAKTLVEEKRCPDVEVNRLVEIQDVSKQIFAQTGKLKGKAFNDALKATMSKIEKDCSEGRDEIRCDVVTLYKGGQYHLYKYQRYQDVRLVFAPEFAAAFFGGDPDNFTFPRYDFDVSFLRVYDQGRPLKNDHFFRFAKMNAGADDLAFITGHPGRTSRLLTVSGLQFTRDVSMWDQIVSWAEMRGLLTQFQKKGPEEKRISSARLFGIENSLKAFKGRYQTLLNEKFMEQKKSSEKKMKEKIVANPILKAEFGTAFQEMDKAYEEFRKIYREYSQIERNNFDSTLFQIARDLVRATAELEKPNEERMREYTDSKLPSMKQELFSTSPIYDEFEILLLSHHFTKLRERLTPDHPFVQKLLGQRSPQDLAESLVKGTKLKDVSVRQKLFDGGVKAIQESKDPMIQFALLNDPEARALRKVFEDDVDSKLKKAEEKIAQARFRLEGTKSYPDATFTLRISYGRIQGYPDHGKQISPITKIQGAFDRHTGQDPFALPETWLRHRSDLNLQTPLNFVSTNDIIGGNSGSPVINQKAEVIGLVFDGNIHSLGGEFWFDENQNRAVSVHHASILEVLKKVYSAQRLVSEIDPQLR